MLFLLTATADHAKVVLTCLFTMLAIIHTVSGGEYCCAYFTAYGTYRKSFFCPKHCCGTSTRKYCCRSFRDRYSPSYTYLSSCPTPTKNPSSWGSWSDRSDWGSWSGSSSSTSTSRPSDFSTAGGTVIGIVAGLVVLWLVIGGTICCANRWRKEKRGTVTKPPENDAVILNTISTTQGYPVRHAPPPNTACRPGTPQPANVAYSSKTQATQTARYEDPPPPYPGTDAEYPPPAVM